MVYASCEWLAEFTTATTQRHISPHSLDLLLIYLALKFGVWTHLLALRRAFGGTVSQSKAFNLLKNWAPPTVFLMSAQLTDLLWSRIIVGWRTVMTISGGVVCLFSSVIVACVSPSLAFWSSVSRSFTWINLASSTLMSPSRLAHSYLLYLSAKASLSSLFSFPGLGGCSDFDLVLSDIPTIFL